MLGRTIDGRFQVLRLLGEGGMGSVYEVRHVVTGRRLALKTITGRVADSPELLRRFEIEAKAAGAIESQHVAHVLDVGVDSSSHTPYLVMEYLAGETLEQALKRNGTLPADVALRVAAQACLGLQKAHEAGIIHRDVKPANIFLAERDAGEVVTKLLDFGIAKVRQDAADAPGTNVTRTGSVVGTPLYMSPEQASGDRTLTPSSDIWSLGVVLYEMLTGETPHHHVKAAGRLIIEICSTPARPVREKAPAVDEAVEAVVMRALALEPSERHASADAMLELLRALVPSFSLHRDMFGKGRPVVVGSAHPSDAAADTVANDKTTPAAESVSGEADTVAASATTTGGRGAHARSAPPTQPKRSGRVAVVLATLVGLGVATAGIVASRSGGAAREPSVASAAPHLPPVRTLEALPPDPVPAPAPSLDAGATSAPRPTATSAKVRAVPSSAPAAPSASPAKKPYDPLSEM